MIFVVFHESLHVAVIVYKG